MELSLALVVLGTLPNQAGGFAESVASAGDVDGDGKCDWLIADSELGCAWIVSGADGHAVRLLGTQTLAAYRPTLAQTQVSSLGDIDGDGRPDALVSAGHGTSQPVRAYSGKDGRVLFEVEGDDAIAIGDVNGDGHPDFVVSTTSIHDREADRARARFRVCSGLDGKTMLAFERDVHAWTAGVFAIGDVDGDGVPDWSAIVREGAAIYSGKTGKELRVFGDVDSMPPMCVCGIRDFDGDGKNDVIVGHPDERCELVGHGSVHVRSCVDGRAILSITSKSSSVGSALCALGDIDRDGVTDFAVASHGGPVHIYSGRTGKSLVEIRVGYGDCEREPCITAVPDVDGDGLPDLLIGASGGECNKVGVAVIVSSKTGSEVRLIERDSLLKSLPKPR